MEENVLIAFGLTLLLTSEVLWNVRDTLSLKLEQQLTHDECLRCVSFVYSVSSVYSVVWFSSR